MAKLQNALAKNIPLWRDEIIALNKKHGDKKISEVTIAQAYGGMRGVKGMVCDTSEVPPETGLLIRGIPIADLVKKTPEDTFYLLCTGQLPNAKDRRALTEEINSRTRVPGYVWKVLEAMPRNSHPMAMLNTAILCMQRESKFAKAYQDGLAKQDYWRPTLEDSLDLLARIPVIAAAIYRMRFNKGKRISPRKGLTWAENYTRMLGLPDPTGEFADLMRLYMVLHSDHEGGNVSAHACHLAGSALSDPYYCVASGLNGLAGPLHGLANQECLRWILDLKKEFRGVPTDKQLTQYAWDTLNSGRVIPGYGHAVLRISDPRFVALRTFGMKHFPDDPVMALVNKVYEIVPGVLKEHGKAKNPWPNVDAGSGALLHHYGLREFSYYTVLFSVSRSMGMLSQLVINRAMGSPLERPKSVTTAWLKKQVK